ncbi:MAG: hypothetical protein M1363_03695 [Gammaproteobacteria bacterium]|nr:hypothetical protein [Gammaproteobacteria bacterium]
MKVSTLLASAVASSVLLSTSVMAHDHGDLHGWLDDYGFSHVTEVEWKSNDRVEVEGFARDNMHSEVVFGPDGQVQSEEHERYAREAWGLSLSQLQKAMEEGKDAGIRRFDEIDVSSRGEVEVEGYDDEGNDIEIKLALNDL